MKIRDIPGILVARVWQIVVVQPHRGRRTLLDEVRSGVTRHLIVCDVGIV